jgi:hypothetical protein
MRTPEEEICAVQGKEELDKGGDKGMLTGGHKDRKVEEA